MVVLDFFFSWTDRARGCGFLHATALFLCNRALCELNNVEIAPMAWTAYDASLHRTIGFSYSNKVLNQDLCGRSDFIYADSGLWGCRFGSRKTLTCLSEYMAKRRGKFPGHDYNGWPHALTASVHRWTAIVINTCLLLFKFTLMVPMT